MEDCLIYQRGVEQIKNEILKMVRKNNFVLNFNEYSIEFMHSI